MTKPSSTITISFQPIKIKLFRSKKKKSLLVIEGKCINGSLNRIRPGKKALIHVRSVSFSLPTIIGGNIECLANALLIDEAISRPLLNKGCWVGEGGNDNGNDNNHGVDTTKLLVVEAHANIERNRRGDRLVECTEVHSIREHDDDIYLPTNQSNEYNEYRKIDGNYDDNDDDDNDDDRNESSIHLKSERHVIFARWIVDTYGKELLDRGAGVLDVAGGNGTISRTLMEMGVRSTLVDPNPRCYNYREEGRRNDSDVAREEEDDDGGGGKDDDDATTATFGVIPHPLNGDGADLTSRDGEIGYAVRNCSFICGLHPDQATEPIVDLALRLNVPFAIVPCCVMPSLFPFRKQRRYNNDPVRSYSAFCRYLLDMAPTSSEGGEEGGFDVDYLPFVGRNKVIYRRSIKKEIYCSICSES